MKLNKAQAFEFNTALSQQNLKAKHVSGENYLKIMSVKTLLKNKLTEVGEAEKSLALEFDATQVTEVGFQIDDKDQRKEFFTKLAELHKAFSIELDLNFMPEKELKEFCKEQDTAFAAILFEYLLEK